MRLADAIRPKPDTWVRDLEAERTTIVAGRLVALERTVRPRRRFCGSEAALLEVVSRKTGFKGEAQWVAARQRWHAALARARKRIPSDKR
jgi:hypothetical protein